MYWAAGWHGIIPLPERRKALPPTGWTGAAGRFPSYPDVQAWSDGPEGSGNIALRLPHHVLGIDVDSYADKRGQDTRAQREAEWGPLPATWRSTSRDDPHSGIYLYRVPEGLAWPGELGPDVELIQHRHRYAVVWPSVHPEGRTYRWITPAGVVSTVPPNVDDLPPLPAAWIQGLTGGRAAEDTARNSLPAGQAGMWLLSRDTHPGADGCRRTTGALHAALTDLAGPGSTHEATRGHVLRLARLAAAGHPGGTRALQVLHDAFYADTTSPARTDGRRDPETAEREWRSLVTGAVNLVTADPNTPPVTPADPCDNPFAGLLPEPTRPVATGTTGLPTPTPATSDGQPAQAAPSARTSWWPQDLTDILAGVEDDPTSLPAFLHRDDGQALFYPGRVNGLLGESESGKSWLALLATLQALQDEKRAHYFDFEDTAPGIIGRLRAMGATDEQLSRLAYIAPDEALHSLAAADLTETLTAHTPHLVVLDGFNAAMTLLGLELESNTDATKFAQQLLKPLSATGAAVVTVDHLPKDREKRGKGGIGAQAKRAMASGCLITVDVLTPAAPGGVGKLHLTVDKDRPGKVRAACLGARNAGTAVIASDAETGDVTVTIVGPTTDAAPSGAFRPTVLMERVSAFLETTPGWVSGRGIESGVRGSNDGIRAALAALAEEGYVTREAGPRGSVQHRHVKTFRADQPDDLIADGQYVDRATGELR